MISIIAAEAGEGGFAERSRSGGEVADLQRGGGIGERRRNVRIAG